jgi:uncharacterized protein VirK/YbjX
MPGLWQGVQWARRRGDEGGGISRPRLVARAVWATFTQASALRRWMAVVIELKSRGIIDDVEGEYLRALRPHVNRGTRVSDRAVQLIDHIDWMESAFHSWALEKINSGQPLVLAELAPPRGYQYMRLQLQRAPVQSPEGELLLTLALQRSADVQHKAMPVEVAAIAFSRFRVEGKGCLVIGGVRGQRDPVNRLSPVELAQALQGWKPPVLMVRVAQELARYWGLHLLGLDPGWHRLHAWPSRWSARARETAQRIDNSYDALWNHFDAHKGKDGWMILPLNSDEKLGATALSPEKRERQTRRADYWIRTRKLLHAEFKALLQRPGREATLSRVTESMGPGTLAPEDSYFDEEFLESGEDVVPSRVLETGPGSLI